MRLYTLGSRGSRELKTFLETRLISSRVDQKLKKKKGEYMLFKEKFGPKMVGSWGDRGGALMTSRGGFLAHGSWLQFRDEWMIAKASISLPNRHDFCHDQAKIGPRSGRDRATIVVLILRRSSADRWETIPQQKRCDRSSIAPRSRLDRTAIVGSSTSCLRRPMKIQAIVIRTIIVVHTIRCHLRDGNQMHQRAPRVSLVSHKSDFIPAVRWRSGAPFVMPRGTR